MRTTVNIDEHLLAQARRAATASRRSLGDVVDDALRMHLAERHQSRQDRVELPTYGGSGLRPGVDLEDKEALSDLLEDDSAG